MMTMGHTISNIDRLTEPQKDCLRLVAELMNSKQIARVLDISHHTVDKRLKRAQATLGVTSRAEAARLLSQHESSDINCDTPEYQSLVHQSSDLSQFRYAETQEAASIGEMSPSIDGGETELRENQAFFFENPAQATEQFTPLSALFETDRENHLSTGSRAALIILIALAGLVGFALLISLAEGISRLV